jgi:anti-anti-sigma factor
VAITRTDLSGLTWIALDGELDFAADGSVWEDLARICDARDHVVVDARGLTFIDLAGLRLLLRLDQRQQSRGARLSLIPGRRVERLMRLVELTRLDVIQEEPGVLLGLSTSDLEVAAVLAHRTTEHERRSLRMLVAEECARQHDLVARMLSLTHQAQSALETVRGSSRAVLEGRARRAAAF